MNAAITADNDRERRRLGSLIESLSEDDLAHDAGDGWTVSAVLGHLAFWDTRIRIILQLLAEGRPLPEDGFEWYGSLTLNTILIPQWLALAPREAARLAMEAASAIDEQVAGVAPVLAERIEASGKGWLLRRQLHRAEHIEQVERALSGR